MGKGGNGAVARDDIFWDTKKEPHAARRRAILKAHPVPEVVVELGPVQPCEAASPNYVDNGIVTLGQGRGAAGRGGGAHANAI